MVDDVVAVKSSFLMLMLLMVLLIIVVTLLMLVAVRCDDGWLDCISFRCLHPCSTDS
jgi:hypothetical protein